MGGDKAWVGAGFLPLRSGARNGSSRFIEKPRERVSLNHDEIKNLMIPRITRRERRADYRGAERPMNGAGRETAGVGYPIVKRSSGEAAW